MFEFLLFGSMVWFWVLFGVFSIVLFVSVETDKAGIATVATLVFLILFAFWGGLPGGGSLLALLAANPTYIIIGVIGFFVLGTLWAVAKWWFYVRDLAEKRKEQIAAHGKGKSYYGVIQKPLVRDNKSRIMTWMCFWPYSFVWTMINDPVRRVFKAIYNQIKDGLQRVADKAFEGLDPEE